MQIFQKIHESLEDIYEDIWEMEDKLEEMADERETAGIWKTVGGAAMIVSGTVAIIALAGELTFRSGIVMLGKEGVSTLAGYGASNLVYDKTNNQTLGMIAGILASMGSAKGLNMADAKLGWSNKGVKGNVVESVTGDIESGRISNLDDGLNFSNSALEHMGESGRQVPIQTLQDAIRYGEAMPDPRGSNATMYYTTMYKNGKMYNLEVLYDEISNTVYHFEYARKAMGNLPAIPK